MADTYIGDLTPGGKIQTEDKIPVEREVTSGTPENFYVVAGSAAPKDATDSTKALVASVNGATTVGNLAVFSDEAGTVADGGEPKAILTGATALTPPVLTTDLVPIIRGGQIFLATIEDLLAAQSPSGGGGQFDFSDSDNSAYAAII